MTATGTPTSRFSRSAVLILLLGLSSSVLFLITGIPAMVLGYYSLRRINYSDGRLRGGGLVVAGMVLGGLGSIAGSVLFVNWVLSRERDRARATECTYNLGRLGMGLNLYHDDAGAYPRGTVPNNDLPPERRLSWVCMVLPHLEIHSSVDVKTTSRRDAQERKIFEKIDFGEAYDAEANREARESRLTVCLCPSWSDNNGGEARKTTYIGIAGVGANAAVIPDFHPPLLIPRDPNAGIFGYDRWTRRDDVTAGLGHTMMVAETTRAIGPWAQGGPATVRGIDPADDPPIGFGKSFGGLHSGVVHVLYADGSVKFINDKLTTEKWLEQARISREVEPVEH
jgi:prepilin-type processing-associated H-X9-DG protein